MIIGNMKRNIYSYSKLWMILFVLMGAACTNQVEDAIPESGQPIEFSVQSDWKEIPNTRLIDDNGTMKFTGGDKVQIFGFHKSSKDAVENVQFMYDVDNHVDNRTLGQKVEFDGTNWNYTPKRFWPKEGLLDFYASYPCDSYNSSIHYDVEKKMMTYENNLTQDLLYGLATDWNRARGDVLIWMVHALAKVNIIFDKSLGDIGQVTVSGYKTGHFSPMNNNEGVPVWDFDDKTPIYANFGYTKFIKIILLPLPYLSCRIRLRDSGCLIMMVIRFMILMLLMKYRSIRLKQERYIISRYQNQMEYGRKIQIAVL